METNHKVHMRTVTENSGRPEKRYTSDKQEDSELQSGVKKRGNNSDFVPHGASEIFFIRSRFYITLYDHVPHLLY
jgi:hypothetical protein